MRRLRCVTFNILHGELGLPAVIRLLQDLAPDVVFLQEVDRHCARSGRVDQTAIIAQALGLHAVFAEAFPLEGGSYGVALLARAPLENPRVHHLPHAAPHESDGRGEPRVLLAAASGPLTLACTHFGLAPEERRDQAEAVREILAPALAGAPLILGGDLNEGRLGSVFTEWSGWLFDAFTEAGGRELESAPADRPRTRIDYVLRSATAPRPTGAFVGPAGASDHRPVIVDFEQVPGVGLE